MTTRSMSPATSKASESLPVLTFATKKLSTAKGQNDAASFFCPRSFDRSIKVAQLYDIRLETRTRETVTRASNKQWSRDYPIDVPATANAYIRYQAALD